MNQEPNNLNPNNFNTQGNNGISNNQPLNNQSFNQGMGFNQQPINPQPQPTPSYEQPIMQQPTPQPMNNTFESGNANNQSLNSKPPKKMNLGLIIGIVAVVAVIGIGIVFGSKLLSNDNNIDNSNNDLNDNVQNNDNSNDSTINYDDLMEMRVIINDTEIILNKTTIDDFLEISKWENYEESSFSTEVNKAIVLKDGVNEITLTYLKSNNVIFQVTTNEVFDNNVTKIQYKDSYIGTLNIGDNIPEEKIKEKYAINKANYRFDIRRTNPSDLIILYEKSSPIVLNYLYHDEEYNLTGFSAWWYIY